MDEKASLALLRECRALLSGHFLLASGLHSDAYFQCARLFERPDAAGRLFESLAAKVAPRVPRVVAGPAIGGIIPAYELARALKVRALYLEKVDGVFALRRGFHVDPGEPVVVAEDVVTTGGSAREAADALRRAGANVVGFAAVVFRGEGDPFPEGLDAMVRVSPKTWKASECPLCASGEPLDKPGGLR
jgi:orotate phosphoribosyltransferase